MKVYNIMWNVQFLESKELWVELSEIHKECYSNFVCTVARLLLRL